MKTSRRKKPNLSEIRQIFPDWQSELDEAKQEGSWIRTAQSFHSAAIVLSEEQKAGQKAFNENVGKPMDVLALMKTQIEIPMLFCYAFSLELALKAVLVKQGFIDALESGQSLPFKSHSLQVLAKDIQNFSIDEHGLQCLKEASMIIEAGKYPVGGRPKEDIEGALTIKNEGVK